YYGDETGSAGTVMTYFPFPHTAKGKRGAGQVSAAVFSVAKASLGDWDARCAETGRAGLAADEAFGETRLRYLGPDGDGFALAEVDGDRRLPFAGGPVPGDDGVHGFHGVTMRLRDGGATGELLKFMGYEEIDRRGGLTRYAVKGGNGADF